MRRIPLLAAAVFSAWSVSPPPALAVDLALVLLNDVSQSMDDSEYAMVKDGYRAAFSDPEVIAALLGNSGGVAVAYVEFSGRNEVHLVRGWDILTDAGSARAFGETVALTPRTSAGDTALAAGIAGAARLLMDSDYGGARQVIDVASDHPSDGGRAANVRDAAVANGITINALPIIDSLPIGTFDGRMTYSTQEWGAGGIAGFYRRDVIGGAGSFVIEAQDYSVFGQALKRKLLLELIATPDRQEIDKPLALVSAAVTVTDQRRIRD